MAGAYKIIKITRKKLLATVFLFIFFTIFILQTNAPSGMRAFRTMDNLTVKYGKRKINIDEVNLRSVYHKQCSDERDDKSWRTPTEVSVSSSEDGKKIAKLVNRILDVEKSLVNYMSQGGGLDSRQLTQLELLTTQMKLVKTLLVKSIYIMKLADIASHGRDLFSHGMEPSSWIAWDHLEPATRDLESDVISLRLRGGIVQKGSGTKQAFAAISFVVIVLVLLIGAVLYAINLTLSVRTRSIKSAA